MYVYTFTVSSIAAKPFSTYTLVVSVGTAVGVCMALWTTSCINMYTHVIQHVYVLFTCTSHSPVTRQICQWLSKKLYKWVPNSHFGFIL